MRDQSPFPIPRPNRTLMWLAGRLNRWLLLPWRFRIERIDLPVSDRDRLRAAVNPSTVAFLAPNHPEFGLDWMLDKEISTICAPEMAAWASHEIVAAAPWFWTRNNLVSHRGGHAAVDYSIDWALHGGGVLLHPEGMVRWTSEVVHPLFPGVAEMAIEAARCAGERAVYVVPVVWKVYYMSDVAPGIDAEISYIERALGLAASGGRSITDRFRLLQENILARQAQRFGLTVSSGANFFEAQANCREQLVAELRSRHTVENAESLDVLIHRIGKIVSTSDDRARVREAERLGSFTSERYGFPTLTQEQLHECLKRIRADLVRNGFRNAVHNALPKPFGPRIARVRVPDPIRVRGDESPSSLLAELRTAMQHTLDEINREIAPLVEPFRRPNPFADSSIRSAAFPLLLAVDAPRRVRNGVEPLEADE